MLRLFAERSFRRDILIGVYEILPPLGSTRGSSLEFSTIRRAEHLI